MAHASSVCVRLTPAPSPSPPADFIYEDVQRDSGAADADNGWSSSEFESYEEQSDGEAKPPPRSKVELARCFREGAGGAVSQKIMYSFHQSSSLRVSWPLLCGASARVCARVWLQAQASSVLTSAVPLPSG